MTYDPNAPAFGPNAQKLEDLEEAKPVVVADAAPIEEVKEPKVEETPEEESKVPYSRFKKFHDQAKQLEQEIAQARAEAEEWRTKANVQPTTSVHSDLPDWWVKLYGDTDASKEAWTIQSKANNDLITQARQEAVEAVRTQAREEDERVSNNLATIDNNLEALNDYAGKALSEADQSAVLDIVDQFSPKDEEGNYLSTIPFERAWDIYVLKQEAGKAPKIKSRDAVAGLTNSRTQGEPTVDAEKDKHFNPLDWNAYKKRL